MDDLISNNRLESFCDGIFGFSITLLILEIKPPELNNIKSTLEIGHQLLSQWPSWFAFFLSFLTLLIAWINHHNMTALLKKTSINFLYANGFLMLTVVIYPFSTIVLGRYLNTEFADFPTVLYCFTTFVHNCGWVLVFYTAAKPEDLSKNEECKMKILTSTKIVIYSCIFNFGLTILAVWYPTTALCFSTSAWLYYLYTGITYTGINHNIEASPEE